MKVEAMQIVNIHQRHIPASIAQVGELLATVASENDRVWPHENWPRMQLDRPIQLGAAGGHGPIAYRVVQYAPQERVRFEFTSGSVGWHELQLQATGEHSCLLTHTIQTQPSLKFRIAWLLVIRHMHDALVEDLFDKLEAQFQPLKQSKCWNAYVKLLRLARGASTQKVPLEPMSDPW
jgi:hypothetical protein